MFVSPMLLQYAKDNKPLNDPSYISELKLDGIRMIVSNMDNIKLYTRHNNDVTSKFPELIISHPLPENTIVDGELVSLDEHGKPDFESVMQRFMSKKSKIKAAFFAFDIIRHKGIDVTGLPLCKRKELLEAMYQETDCYKLVKPVIGDSIAFFDIVSKQGLEGIVMKRRDSKYEVDRRSWSWQKVINWTYAEVYISGYRKDEFGWLASVVNSKGMMFPAGLIELGVTSDHKKAFNSIKNRIYKSEDKNFVYTEPLIRAKVKTRNWTKQGKLRSPVFVEFIL